MAKTFLAVVGLLYLGLAAWCTIDPATTSGKVGFDLRGGSGSSEFLVIYGGLELAMALIFLLPLIKNRALAYSLLSCLIIHACLVAFRSISLLLFSEIESTTYRLAIGEWIILIASALLYFQHTLAAAKSSHSTG